MHIINVHLVQAGLDVVMQGDQPFIHLSSGRARVDGLDQSDRFGIPQAMHSCDHVLLVKTQPVYAGEHLSQLLLQSL